jgi:hypothetical protein
MVEQWDAEDYQHDPDNPESDIPPVYTKTWFHTGFYKSRNTISTLYQQEYFQGDAQMWLLPDTALPNGLTANEVPEACRVLKGSILRQEVYALDGSDQENIPYTVQEKTYKINKIQDLAANNKHAVFHVLDSESLSYHYERNATDPRIQHQMSLKADKYGNIKKAATIGYPRRNAPADLPEQNKLWVSYQEASFINEDNNPNFYRIGVPKENLTYEVMGLTAPNNKAFEIEDILTYVEGGANLQLLSHSKQFYYNEDTNAALPLGEVASLALLYQTQLLSYDEDLLDLLKEKI